MRDELVPGKEVGAYWIKDVLRHGGTEHLQVNSKDLPFHQRHLLDVVAFLLSLLLLRLFLSLFIIYYVGSYAVAYIESQATSKLKLRSKIEKKDRRGNKPVYYKKLVFPSIRIKFSSRM